MSFITKPKIVHPSMPRNALGLTVRDYEGGMSTLCAGCGHDSVTSALVQAAFELDVEPHRMAKLSGIGCSSKTPAYFLKQSHGFNSVHGRMPSVATGANAANRELLYVGVSGDGDSLSIGMGQFVHAMRRNLDMLYVIENNGVYGLTKGQFSASADIGSTAKKGDSNEQPPIDPCELALSLGCGYVARSFSGDKAQLVPLLKGAMKHRGFALVDVISPCVTFNDHEGSTKSYQFTRDHYHPAILADYIAPSQEIRAEYEKGAAMPVVLHDGSQIVLRKTDPDYDPTDLAGAFAYLQKQSAEHEHVTGLLYVNEEGQEMHALNHTVDAPLNGLDYDRLCPGSEALATLQENFR